jgi:hypothetical protein
VGFLGNYDLYAIDAVKILGDTLGGRLFDMSLEAAAYVYALAGNGDLNTDCLMLLKKKASSD